MMNERNIKKHFSTVWFAILWMLPMMMLAETDGYTEQRGYFFGAYLGYDNVDINETGSYPFEDNARNWQIHVANGWFLKDNLAVGIKLGYSQEKYKTLYQEDNSTYNTKENIFQAGIFMRNYFRLAKNVKFFIETSVVAGFGSGDVTDSTAGLGSMMEEDIFLLEAGFRPGLAFFLFRGVAVEATAGWVGLSHSKYEFKYNESNTTTTKTSTSVDFSQMVNDIEFRIGVAIYL